MSRDTDVARSGERRSNLQMRVAGKLLEASGAYKPPSDWESPKAEPMMSPPENPQIDLAAKAAQYVGKQLWTDRPNATQQGLRGAAAAVSRFLQLVSKDSGILSDFHPEVSVRRLEQALSEEQGWQKLTKPEPGSVAFVQYDRPMEFGQNNVGIVSQDGKSVYTNDSESRTWAAVPMYKFTNGMRLNGMPKYFAPNTVSD